MGESSGSSFTVPINEDYESDFEFDADVVGEKRKARVDLAYKSQPSKIRKPNRQSCHDQCALELGRAQQRDYLALDAYSRHKKLINEYVLCYRGTTEKLKRNTSNYKTDHDVIREHHRFLWEEEDDAKTWGEQLAKKYYDRLFKEYCLCDLSKYKDKKIGMRWRTEKEVILGKGQFFCGSVNCEKKDDLNSWEVLFGYLEQGVKKSALVKLRLCEKCSDKLQFGYKGKAVLKRKKNKKGEKLKSDDSGDADESSLVKVIEEPKEGNSSENDIWKQPVKEDIEPQKEDVFEEFLEDLFL